MLTMEENELLTRVGPGTPCGDLLRCYWHPVALAEELTPERPKLRVKILGEELVLYRVAEGPGARGRVTGAGQDQVPALDPRSPTPVRYGLVSEHCSHRGVSLYYGFLEDGGIRCPYHGWLYDETGRCLEQPFEPAQSMMKHAIKHPAYPVEGLAGLLFAYLGVPDKRPLLPRWDVLVWRDGNRKLRRQQTLDCNWLQAEENSADVIHTYFLHGHTMRSKGLRGGEYYYRPIERYGFQPFEWGIVKSWVYNGAGTPFGDERGGGNPLIFPNLLRVREGPWHAIHWRVPVDDETTEIFWAGFMHAEDVQRARSMPDFERDGLPPIKTPDGVYPMTSFPSQDTMAWETQGRIFDRGREHLGASDRGIVMFRRMLREQIEVVQRGSEPMAIVRDPERNRIIELPVWVSEGEIDRLAEASGTRPTLTSMEAVFDDRHETFEVPIGAARPVPSPLGNRQSRG